MVPKRIGERLLAAMSDVIVPVAALSTVAVFEAMHYVPRALISSVTSGRLRRASGRMNTRSA